MTVMSKLKEAPPAQQILTKEFQENIVKSWVLHVLVKNVTKLKIKDLCFIAAYK